MSTVFDFRNLRLPKLSRASIIIGSLAIVAALVLGFLGIQLYKKLTNNTVVAYFPVANALYNGDRVEIMGVKVGAIDKIEPAGDKMKVTFHYSNKYKVPADAQAVILNPTLVASRLIQLEPPYKGGPVLADNAVIPEERTQVPTEWDELRNTITNVISKLGPTKEQPKGPFGDVIEAYADGLAGKGKQINTTFNDLSRALTALNQGRGDFFAVVRSLALFVNALHADDQKFVALNKNLAQFTNSLTGSDRDLANAVQKFDGLLTTVRPFLDKNAEVLTHDINNLADTTNTLVQPEPLNGLETGLHVLPTALSNANLIYHPAHSAIVGQPAGDARHAGFREPDGIHLQRHPGRQPAGLSGIRRTLRAVPGADSRRDQVQLPAVRPQPVQPRRDVAQGSRLLREPAASAERLQGHHRAGYLGARHPDVAPQHPARLDHRARHAGRQGGPITAGLLTPESLAELMGGPDIAPVQSNLPDPAGIPECLQRGASDRRPIIGVPGNPAPIPPPPPGPEVIPGPVAPTPAPGPSPLAGQAPAGPALPAEAASAPGGGQ